MLLSRFEYLVQDDDESALLQALIDDLYDVSITGGDMSVEFKQAKVSADYTITGTQSNHIVQFDTGDFDATNNGRVYVEADGIATIAANFYAFSSGANFADLYIRKNGTEIVAASKGSSAVNRAKSAASVESVEIGDYFEMLVTTNGTVVLDADFMLPSLSIQNVSS